MQVLQLNKELMALFSILDIGDGTPWTIRLRRLIIVTFMFVALAFGWVSSVVFIIKYVKTDLGSALYAIFQVAAEFSANYTAFITCLYPESVESFFTKLNYVRGQVIDQKKSLARCFDPFDSLCHKLTQLMVNTMFITYIILSIVQGILNTAYCYYYRDDGIDPQCLYIPYKFSSPWDQNNIVGRCGTILWCAIQGNIYIYVTTTFLAFFISTSLQFNAFRIYMKGLVNELDNAIEQSSEETVFLSILRDIVRLHVGVKGLFQNAADIFNRFTFVQVFSAVIFTSSNFLNMDLAIQNPGADIGIILYVTAVAVANLYFYCYFGEYTSNCFADYPKIFFECRWHELPVKYQKYFILMISNSQLPMTYDGFKLVSLNLESFQKVLKTSASYYLIMRAAVFE